MQNDGFDVLPLDKLEQIQTSGVEEVVPRHCLNNYVEDEVKGIVLRDLVGVELVLQRNTCSEELQRCKLERLLRDTQ